MRQSEQSFMLYLCENLNETVHSQRQSERSSSARKAECRC